MRAVNLLEIMLNVLHELIELYTVRYLGCQVKPVPSLGLYR